MRDREYVTRFQAGDFEAFAALYEKYMDRIFAFVYRKTSQRETAEDLTSQVWMKALRGLEYFGENENANFKAWIYCIANNTVIDYYRTNKPEQDIDEIVEPGISEDFAKHIDDKDTLKAVREYLKQLKPLEQEIFVMRIWDDMSYKHIAKILWKSEDACKKSFSRTIKKVVANVSVLLLVIIFFAL